MKRRITALLLAGLLAGCTVTAPKETAAGPLGEAGEAYAYSNMQKNMPSGDFAYDGTQIVFLQAKEGLYTYDLATGAVLEFCQDATCTHEKTTCSSRSVTGNLERYDGQLYALRGGYVSVRKGEGFETVLEHGGVSQFFHANGDLYVHTRDNSLLRYPGGTGEKQVLIEEYRGYFATVFGDYLYYSQMDGFHRLNLTVEGAQPELVLVDVGGMTDGEHIYYNALDTNHLYRCNLDGTDPELLIADVVLMSRAAFDETYFYFLRYEVTPVFPHMPDGESSVYLCRFPKDDPGAEERLATIPYSDGAVYLVPGYDRLLICGNDYSLDPNYPPRYLFTVNRDGTDLREHPLPEA